MPDILDADRVLIKTCQELIDAGVPAEDIAQSLLAGALDAGRKLACCNTCFVQKILESLTIFLTFHAARQAEAPPSETKH